MPLNSYLVGNRVVMLGTCCVVTDPANDPDTCTNTDPTTVTFTRRINPPTGPAQNFTYSNGDPEVTNLAVGIWACTVDVDTAGEETWRFEGDGACHAAAEDIFEVTESMLT